jgi:8-oxo-dGTP diphosphatase
MIFATLCYIRKNDRTLMIHRVKREGDMHAGKWNGLGGKIIPGETPEECVVREVYEESGLKLKKPLLRGVLTFPGFANDEDWYAFVFLATEFEGDLVESEEGYLQWVPNEEILDLELWDGDQIFIPWLDRPEFFSGKFMYQNGSLVEHQVVFHSLGQ